MTIYLHIYCIYIFIYPCEFVFFFLCIVFFLGEQHQVVNITYTSSSKYPLYKYLINLRLYYMYIGKSSVQTMRVQIIYIFCKKQYTYINQTWAISPLLGLIAYLFLFSFFQTWSLIDCEWSYETSRISLSASVSYVFYILAAKISSYLKNYSSQNWWGLNSKWFSTKMMPKKSYALKIMSQESALNIVYVTAFKSL